MYDSGRFLLPVCLALRFPAMQAFAQRLILMYCLLPLQITELTRQDAATLTNAKRQVCLFVKIDIQKQG